MCKTLQCYLLAALIGACVAASATNLPLSSSLQQHIFASTPTPRAPYCPLSVANQRNAIYLLYDINPPEGFNLRRDVYIRLAVFVRQLQQRSPSSRFANIRLVLPPWRRLYHWRSSHLQQDSLPWSTFFDVESLRRYAPVLDFPEFMQEMAQLGLPQAPYVPVDKVLQLLHFEEMFDNGVFRDKFEFVNSDSDDCYKEQYLRRGDLLQQSRLLDDDFQCVRFQGSASLLQRVLRKALSGFAADGAPRIVALLNAEIVLHEHWGDREFWRARRSMRFASPLVRIADDFIGSQLAALNIDNVGRVQRPAMWEYEAPYRQAMGGDYLCAHLRRGDFLNGRERTTPTLKSAAAQIKQQLQALNLNTVFLATDAGAFEIKNLRAYLQRSNVVRFAAESLEQKALIKDGGIAIVDQLVCAHARHFIGTYESTFTYRIYEEREILGFARDSTFNTFCKSESLQNCSKNSVWPIVY